MNEKGRTTGDDIVIPLRIRRANLTAMQERQIPVGSVGITDFSDGTYGLTLCGSRMPEKCGVMENS